MIVANLILLVIFLTSHLSLSNAQNPFCYRTYEDPCFGADPSDYTDGDLISPGLPGEQEGSRKKRGATAHNEFLWPNGKVYYTIGNGYSDEELDTIFGAMHHIENQTCIRFEEKTDDTEDYINVFPGTGCCSYIGYIGCGRQGISLAHGCINRGTIVHEMLHALGFFHEHSRPDRDQYVKIIEENIQEVALPNFQKLKPQDIESYDIDYDYNSVMHYCKNSFSVSKDKNTLVPLEADAIICNACELSPLDTIQINLLYSCDLTNSPPLSTPLPAKRLPPALTLPFPNCGATYDRVLEGEFSSPGYSNGPNAIYLHDIKCGWVFRAQEGYRLTFKITVSLEFNSGCTKDYIQAFYGSQSSRKRCGESIITIRRVTDFTLHLVTDESNGPSSRTYKGITGEFTSNDINECTDSSICSHGCVNTKGSYYCTCPDGLYLSNCNGRCLDINECDENVHECDDETSICKNNYGSYSCKCKNGYLQQSDQKTCLKEGGVSCSTNNGGCSQICSQNSDGVNCLCRDGYELHSDDATCVDIDECIINKGGCQHICTNTNGSYECSCLSGHKLNKNNHSCSDINECRDITEDLLCDNLCINYPGGYFCFCQSVPGLRYGPDYRSCIDIDECETANGGCEHNCINIPNSYECACSDGFALKTDQKTCQDIDECSSNNGGCDHICNNTLGSYECSCRNGYKLENNGISCQDIDECSSNNGGCDEICINTLGSYECSCEDGFKLTSNNKSCQDIDECAVNIDGCDQSCTNTEGSYYCSCDEGYIIENDRVSCQDINECIIQLPEGEIPCSHFCNNTQGSFMCNCPVGYTLSSDNRTCLLNLEPSSSPVSLQSTISSQIPIATPSSPVSPQSTISSQIPTTVLPIATSSPVPPTVGRPCGANLTTESDVITYNDSFTGDNCFWNVALNDESKYLYLTIEKMNFVPNEEDCSKCYVEIFNGDSDKAILLGRYCSAETNKIQTAINKVTIRYQSTGCSGSFEISYTSAASATRPMSECTTVLIQSKGFSRLISSKEFPNPSFTSTNYCHIYVYAFGSTIRFTILYIDESETCNLDFYSSFAPSQQTLVSSICTSPSIVTYESKNYGLLTFTSNNLDRGFLGRLEII